MLKRAILKSKQNILQSQLGSERVRGKKKKIMSHVLDCSNSAFGFWLWQSASFSVFDNNPSWGQVTPTETCVDVYSKKTTNSTLKLHWCRRCGRCIVQVRVVLRLRKWE